MEKGGEPVANKNQYHFDSKIHIYRATKRMTQQELADLVGVSRQTIMQLERNRYNPSMLLAYAIARVFDVSIEELFDFWEDEKMIEILNEIANSTTLFIVGAWFGLVITIVLIILFFVKSSRDERGRSIIGKASIISTIVFIVLVNFVCKILDNIEINYVTMGFCFQWIYDIVLAVEVIAILIYKRIE